MEVDGKTAEECNHLSRERKLEVLKLRNINTNHSTVSNSEAELFIIHGGTYFVSYSNFIISHRYWP